MHYNPLVLVRQDSSGTVGERDVTQLTLLKIISVKVTLCLKLLECQCFRVLPWVLQFH